jgi:hypothetical protein
MSPMIAIEPMEDHGAGCNFSHQQPACRQTLRQHSNTTGNKHSAPTKLNSAQQESWSLPMKGHRQPQPEPQETATQNTTANGKA